MSAVPGEAVTLEMEGWAPVSPGEVDAMAGAFHLAGG